MGTLLLREAVESHAYSILAAQARTRFKIVGAGAKSLETPRIFYTIVKDTVTQDDDCILTSNMRTAIKATNVNLDLPLFPVWCSFPVNSLFSTNLFRVTSTS